MAGRYRRLIRPSFAVATVVAVVLAVGLALAAGPADVPAAPARSGIAGDKPAKAENPHWRADGCPICHKELQGPDDVPKAPPPHVEALCLGCHDEKRASGETHPVGVAPTFARVVNPTVFPLEDGRLVCTTCHSPIMACKRQGLVRPAFNHVFLRGLGPTQTADSFCKNCHSPDQYKKVNPHIMLDAKGGVVASRCLICHIEVPDRTTRMRSGKPLLRGAKTEMCLGCHQIHSDMNPKGHLGTAITPAVANYIRARDVGVLYEHLKQTAPPGRAASQAGRATTQAEAATTQADKEARVREAVGFPLALDPAGKIVCATCHNPHQQQVFPPDSILAYGAGRVTPEGRVTPGVTGQQICQDCHDLSQLIAGGRRGPTSRPAGP